MDINLYLLKFCGMFDCAAPQRSLLCSSNLLVRKQILEQSDPHTWQYIHNQYYPSFRRFITNEPSDIDDFTILSATPELLAGSYRKTLNAGGAPVELSFSISNAEIFLFKHNPGILALEISLSQPSLELFSALVNDLRNYNSRITDAQTGEELQMLDLVQDRMLNKAAGVQTFDLRRSAIADYRGAKMKVFQAVDFASRPERELNKILFELGTVSRIGSSEELNDVHSHCPEYYEQITGNALRVFNNWSALCLLDTFTMVGFSYLSNPATYKTWSENYFRIYVHDLYFKYYLFSLNGDGFYENNRLQKQRREFYHFLRIYDTDPISYNFLPNLIHSSIKTGLQTQAETDALMLRIDRINGLINEEYSRISNLILFIISVIALIPTNWNDMVDFNDDKAASDHYNRITFFVKIAFVAVAWMIALTLNGSFKRTYRRWFKKRVA